VIATQAAVEGGRVMEHRFLVAAWVAGALVGGSPATARGEEVLRATGTGSALGAMRRLAPGFERANPGFRLRLLPSLGSSGALKAVADGAIEVALSGRPLRPEELALGLLALPYARTPFVFAAGPRVEVPGITAAEAVRIYRGEQQRWPNGERVRLVLRPRADMDTTIVASISAEMAAAVEVAMDRPGMLMAATNQDCHEILVRTPGSIGPSTLTQVLTEDLVLRPLAWNGVTPTLPHLGSGQYPLEKKLFLVVRAPPSPAVRRFLAYLATAEAAAILEQAGNLPVPLPAVE
jgi:phosphate transport system substrate-binding protein